MQATQPPRKTGRNIRPVAPGTHEQTVQINGVAWQQSEYVCASAIGGPDQEIGMLISVSLHNNKYYSMDYISRATTFAGAYQTFFNPMATSFKLK